MPIISIALAIVVGLLAFPSNGSAELPAKRIGILAAAPFPAIESLEQGLRERGWTKGQNISFEYRWAQGDDSRYPALAAELVDRKVDAIVTWGTPAAIAAKAATITIPIILGAIGDPVEAGVVTNFRRPGGNITGYSSQNIELDGKRLDLLKELLPKMVRASFLSNKSNPSVVLGEVRANRVTRGLGLTIDTISIEKIDDLDRAFQQIVKGRPDAVLVVADTQLLAQRQRIVEFMAKDGLPAMYAYPEFPKIGGLISYSTDYSALLRQAADYVDRILKGEAPGDLPIQRASKFELVVNLNTAKSLGITVPQAILTRAEEVIE